MISSILLENLLIIIIVMNNNFAYIQNNKSN